MDNSNLFNIIFAETPIDCLYQFVFINLWFKLFKFLDNDAYLFSLNSLLNANTKQKYNIGGENKI